MTRRSFLQTLTLSAVLGVLPAAAADIKCSHCNGTGKCSVCQGNGKTCGHKCYLCDGTGTCYACRGTGKA